MKIRWNNRYILLLVVAVTLSGCADRESKSVSAGSGHGDDDSSLYVSNQRMQEWNDWRFGLFIHWGPWSQTKVGYIWKMVNEDPPGVREKRFDLYKTFNPVDFDPRAWARAAKNAGMKYVVFVVKHHDGFNNYDTALSDFKITSPECPWSRSESPDITRAIVDAFRAEGLAIGFYFSHIDWHHPDGRYFSRDYWDYDPRRIDTDPESWERFVEYEKGQIRELLTNYGKIDIIWFDISWPFAGEGGEAITHPRVAKDMRELIAMMKDLQPDIIFNDRGTGPYGAFYTPEQQVPEVGLPGNWESNITITNDRGFWYKGENVSAKSPEQLIRMLVEIASKGGNFLMNVGPSPAGRLAPGEPEALAGIGAWMKVNGESIYGTTRSVLYDLPWGRSTTRGNTLYLHVVDWPADGRLVVPGLLTPIANAYRLADPGKTSLAVTRAGEDQIVQVGTKTGSEPVTVVVAELSDKPEVMDTIRQHEADAIVLSSARADVESATARYRHGRATRHGDYIEGLQSEADRVTWRFQNNHPGRYRVVVQYALQMEQAGSSFTLALDGGKPITATTVGTANWSGDFLELRNPDYVPGKGERHDNRWTFKTFDLGTFQLDEAGKHTLELRPENVSGDYLFLLKSIQLVPVAD